MKLKIYSSDGSSNQEAEFNQIESFEGSRGRQAIKEVIVAHQANARQGTASTKTRAEVRGGGKKPWRQKGTGNARAGSNRSPIWSGGGVVFGPRPRDYSKKINKKVKSLATRRILFDRASRGDIVVIEDFDLQEPKTKLAHTVIRAIAPKGRVLFIEERFSDNAILASRNLQGVDLAESSSLNTLALAGYSKIIFTRKGIDSFITRLNGGSK